MNFNLIIPCSLLHGFRMSFWLVQNTFDPSLEKRGKGRFMENRFIQKIPLNPPLPKGENARKDSLRVVDPTSGNDKRNKDSFCKVLTTAKQYFIHYKNYETAFPISI